jgi:hypothetical protein
MRPRLSCLRYLLGEPGSGERIARGPSAVARSLAYTFTGKRYRSPAGFVAWKSG